MMSHSYFRRKPPKTTGREEFGEPFVRQTLATARHLRLPPADIVATVTAFTAASIANAYERFIFPMLSNSARQNTQVILGGGGAKNVTLRKMISERLGLMPVMTQTELGNSNVAKEAMAFAVLAHETLQSQPSNVPSATGARRAVILGKIVPSC
jgi:anhydro-N-acetylmuramic acid kinase